MQQACTSKLAIYLYSNFFLHRVPNVFVGAILPNN